MIRMTSGLLQYGEFYGLTVDGIGWGWLWCREVLLANAGQYVGWECGTPLPDINELFYFFLYNYERGRVSNTPL